MSAPRFRARTKGHLAVTPPPTPAIGGGWARTDSSFLTGKTIQSLTADFGGVGNDSTDNFTALSNALAWVKGADNRALYIPTGTYRYSGQLNTYTNVAASRSGGVVYGDGPQLSILKGMDNVVVSGGTRVNFQNVSNFRFSDFQIFAPNTTARPGGSQTAPSYGLHLGIGCSDCLIYNVWVQGVGGGHIMATSTPTRITAQYCKVGWGNVHPGADGIHFDGAGLDCVIQFCLADNTGDDALVAISTVGNQGSGFQVLDSIVLSTSFAAGIRVDGWDNVEFRRNTVSNSASAGIKLSAEGSYNGSGVHTATIDSNVLNGCVQQSSLRAGQAAIYLYTTNASQTISAVTLSNNQVNNPLSTVGIRGSAGNSGEPIDATLTSNAMTNTTGNMTTGIVASANCTFTKSGNTLNGAPA